MNVVRERPLPLLTPGLWRVDPARSIASFRIRAMLGMMTVNGCFNRLDGKLRVNDDRSVDGNVRIHLESLRTGMALRDAHLRSAAFFDAKEYPLIEFFAHTLIQRAPASAMITGDLHSHGFTHGLELEASLEDGGGDSVELATAAAVDRRDLGVNFNFAGAIPWRVDVAARIYLSRELATT